MGEPLLKKASARPPTVTGLSVVLIALLAALVTTAASSAGQAATRRTTTTTGNPLAGARLGVYTGGQDGVYPAYEAAVGPAKDLLAKLALRPRVRWFGSFVPNDLVTGKVADYIAQAQEGDPTVIVPMATFRLWPHSEAHRDDPVSYAERVSYRQWVDNVALGIGSSRVVIVVEPDLAVALKGWRPIVRLHLARYAARVFSSLPNTTVYLDASDSDWLKVPKARAMLVTAGVSYTRGFALGATHYSSTADNIAYGKRLVAALRRAGVPGRHFVIDTADNGRPFTWLQFHADHPGGDFDNADTCRTLQQVRCVTLGIPPTTNVADPRWGLPEELLTPARRRVDAYLWFGRPWLYRQATPFDLNRSLAIAATTPY
jgi:endoglucanase